MELIAPGIAQNMWKHSLVLNKVTAAAPHALMDLTDPGLYFKDITAPGLYFKGLNSFSFILQRT